MTAEARRQDTKPTVGEEVKEILLLAPTGMPGPVYENQWMRVSLILASLVDQFEHVHSCSRCVV